jgi:malonyl-CoA O-methyltransferase
MILDIGCGTGLLAGLIAEKFPASIVTGLDLAPGMIEFAACAFRRPNLHFMEGDGEELPFKSQEFDLIISNASLQWMNTDRVIAETSRVLKTGGHFIFSTFGPLTLCELKRAGFNINELPSKEEIENILVKYYKKTSFNSEIIYRKYKNVFEVFSYLKAIGAQNPKSRTRQGLLTKQRVSALFSDHPDGLEISFEIICGSCIK